MHFRRKITPRTPVASPLPRALAIVSCALALLAAEAGMGAFKARAAAPAERPSITVAHAAPVAESVVTQQRRESDRKTLTASPATWISSARRTHILATFEIFHRLLLAELQAPPATERLLIPAISLDPVAVELVPPTLLLSVHTQILTDQTYRTPPPERQFALDHCLLAPPIA